MAAVEDRKSVAAQIAESNLELENTSKIEKYRIMCTGVDTTNLLGFAPNHKMLVII